MELELGLKITRTRDDVSSSSEFQFAKDRSGPFFLSRETNSMYILTAYLKGYKEENLEISINEDGTQIAISGERPVQEMCIMGWIMYKGETELKGFRKVFRIPDGVILDSINARFDDEESVLTVVMPKMVRGIYGDGIKEEEELESSAGTSATVQTADEDIPDRDISGDIQDEEAKDEMFDDIFQAAEENVDSVEPGTDTTGELATEGTKETSQARKESIDREAEPKKITPDKALEEESAKKIREETTEPGGRIMVQIEQVVDKPEAIQEPEEETPVPVPICLQKKEPEEAQRQKETDKPGLRKTPKIEEMKRGDKIQQDDDIPDRDISGDIQDEEAKDERSDVNYQAAEENVDSMEMETGITGELATEQMKETSQTKEESIDREVEPKTIIPDKALEKSGKKPHVEATEPEGTTVGQINQVVDMPEAIQEPEEETPVSLPTYQEKKELEEVPVQKETDKPGLKKTPKIEEMKTHDEIHQDDFIPERGISKDIQDEEAKDARFDDNYQAAEKKVDSVEPGRGDIEELATEQMKETGQAKEEDSVNRETEPKTVVPDKALEEEIGKKLREETTEPGGTILEQINQVVDKPKAIKEPEEETPASVPTYQEEKEPQEIQMQGADDKLDLRKAPRIEEMKREDDIHRFEGRKEKQDDSEVDSPPTTPSSQETKEPGKVKLPRETDMPSPRMQPTIADMKTKDIYQLEDHARKRDSSEVEAHAILPTIQEARVPEEVRLENEADKPGQQMSLTIEEMKTRYIQQPEDQTRKKDHSEAEPPVITPTYKKSWGPKEVQMERQTDKPGPKMAQTIKDVQPKDIVQPENQTSMREKAKAVAPSRIPTIKDTREPQKAQQKRDKDIPSSTRLPTLEQMKKDHKVEDQEREQDNSEAAAPASIPTFQDTRNLAEFQLQKETDTPGPIASPTIEVMKTKDISQPKDQKKEQEKSEEEVSAIMPPFQDTRKPKEVWLQKESERPSPTALPTTMKTEDIQQSEDRTKKQEHPDVEAPAIIPTFQETSKVEEAPLHRELNRSGQKLAPSVKEMKTEDTQPPEDQIRKGDNKELEAAATMPALQEIGKQKEVQVQREGDTRGQTMPPATEGIDQLQHQAREQEDQEIEGPSIEPTTCHETKKVEEVQLQRKSDRLGREMPPPDDQTKSKDTRRTVDQVRKPDDSDVGALATTPKVRRVWEPGEVELQKGIGRKGPKVPSTTREVRSEDIHQLKDQVRKQEYLQLEASDIVPTPRESRKLEEVQRQKETDRTSQKMPSAVEKRKTEVTYQPEDQKLKQDKPDVEASAIAPTFQEIREPGEVQQQRGTDRQGPKMPPAIEEEKTIDTDQPEAQPKKQDNIKVKGPVILPTPQQARKSEDVQPQKETDRPRSKICRTVQELKTTHQPKDQKRQQVDTDVEAPATTPTIQETRKPGEFQVKRETDRKRPVRPPPLKDMRAEDIGKPEDWTSKQDIAGVEGPDQQQTETDTLSQQMPPIVREMKTEDTHEPKDQKRKQDISDVEAPRPYQEIRNLEKVQLQRETEREGHAMPPAIEKTKAEDMDKVEDQTRKQDNTGVKGLVQWQKGPDLSSPKMPPSAREMMKTKDNLQPKDQTRKQDKSNVEAPGLAAKYQDISKLGEVQPRETGGQGPAVAAIEEMKTKDADQLEDRQRKQDNTEVEGPVQQQKEIDKSSHKMPSTAKETKTEDTHQRRPQDSSDAEVPALTPTCQEIRKPGEVQVQRETDTQGPKRAPATEELKTKIVDQVEEQTRKQDNIGAEGPEEQKLTDKSSQIMPPIFKERKTEDTHKPEDQTRKQDSSHAEVPQITPTSEESIKPGEVQLQAETDRQSPITPPAIKEVKTEDVDQLEDWTTKQDNIGAEGPVQQQTVTDTSSHEKPPIVKGRKTEDTHQPEDQTKEQDSSDAEVLAISPAVQEIRELRELQLRRETDRQDPIMQPATEEMKTKDPDQLEDQTKKQDNSGAAGPVDRSSQKVLPLVKPQVGERHVDEFEQVESAMAPGMPKEEDSISVPEPEKLESKQKAEGTLSPSAQDEKKIAQKSTLDTKLESQQEPDEERICTEKGTEDDQNLAKEIECLEESDEESIYLEREETDEESICIEREVDECEYIDIEKEEKKSGKPRPYPPLIVAKSAFLVSIIVIVVRYIRTRKRQTAL